MARGVDGGQRCSRWPGVSSVACGVAGGQGCRRWPGVLPVARGVVGGQTCMQPVARGVARAWCCPGVLPVVQPGV